MCAQDLAFDPASHTATASAAANSLRRNEWSPSTKINVTGPAMAAVSRSSSYGVAKASRRPETNRHGTRMSEKCSVRRRSGRPGGCRG